MIEKDNIQELFSKAFENQTAPVRPDLWAGVQAKMAAAGVASTATVATKGLSALTKWIIGSAAVGTVGVVTAVVALNSGEETTIKQSDSPKEISQNMGPVASSEENKKEAETFSPHTIYTKPNVVPEKPSEDHQNDGNTYTEINSDASVVKEHVSETPKTEKRTEGKATPLDNNKKDDSEKTDSKKPLVDHKNEPKETPPVKHPENNTSEPVFVALEAKVTKFPTMFTPNGDRSNDTYFVTVENINDFQLVIIDQDNREMFRTNNSEDEWNGTNKAGEEAPSGSYAAIVTGKQQNGKSFRDIQLFELKR